MQKLVQILGYTTMNGVSQKTGEPWVMNDMHVKWQELPPGAQPYECEMVMTVSGELNAQAVERKIKTGETVPVTFYVGVRSWKDRKYTDIRGYLPKELLMAKPL